MNNIFSQTSVQTFYYKYNESLELYQKINSSDSWEIKRIVEYNPNLEYNFKMYDYNFIDTPSFKLPYKISDFDNNGEKVHIFYSDKYLEIGFNPIEAGINNGMCQWYMYDKIWIWANYRNGKIYGKALYDVGKNSYSLQEIKGCLDGDCINGIGYMKYVDGSYYYGKFLNEKLDGFGTYTFSSGQTLKGNFSNNKYIPPQNNSYNYRTETKITASDLKDVVEIGNGLLDFGLKFIELKKALEK